MPPIELGGRGAWRRGGSEAITARHSGSDGGQGGSEPALSAERQWPPTPYTWHAPPAADCEAKADAGRETPKTI